MNVRATLAKIFSGLAVVAMLALGLSAPGFAQSAGLAVFDNVAKGEWTVRFRDGSPSKKLCVRSGQELLQLRHTKPGCSQVVIANEVSEVTVQYACRGDGYGRTTVRMETSSLLQIDSQGIAGDRPFEFHAEARRTGECS